MGWLNRYLAIVLGGGVAAPQPPGSPAPVVPGPSVGGTVVQRHGSLSARGNRIVDKNGNPVRLRGMSMFWSQWSEGSKFYTRNTVKWLVDDWGIDVVRAAMAVEHGGYLVNPQREKARVETVCDAAIEFGVYCLIDWHDHNAEWHLSQAKQFFATMATKYGQYPNVLFETFNEPIDQDWSSVIKPYHEEVLQSIRASSQNLVVLGSSLWSQDVDIASRDPVQDSNVAYTLHFYASTHRQWNRDKASVALAAGLAVFATEWGTCAADGNGVVDLAEVQIWHQFLADNWISEANWAISDKAESCAALRPGASAAGWHLNQLTQSGSFMRTYLRGDAGSTPRPTPRPTPQPTPPAPPTSSPTPPPSPTPPQCRMEDAEVPAGRRCKGKPVGGWGSLGKGLTADECKQACIEEDTCDFAVYKQGTCSHFKACKKHKRQAGFTVWRKDCDADPSPPNPACIALCDLVDLSAGGETCHFLSRFPVLCNRTRVREGTVITPCRATLTACLSNTWGSLQCPGFDEQCAGRLGLSETGNLTVSSPVESRRFAKWRFNKWRALIQISQSVWRREL